MNDVKDLIEIKENENGEIAVSGRQLHYALGIGTQYDKWIKRMIEYGFEGNVDYIIQSVKVQSQKRLRTYEQVDHIMTLDMSKELAMIQRTEIGKKIRRYFIQVEKAYKNGTTFKNPIEDYSRKDLLRLALDIEEENERLTQENEQHLRLIKSQKPKVLFADTLAGSNNSILVQELAKLITQKGYHIGPYKLFEWLRENGYLTKRKGESWNLPTQKSMNLGVFEIKKGVRQHADGSPEVTRTTKVTPKGQEYFINKFLGQQHQLSFGGQL